MKTTKIVDTNLQKTKQKTDNKSIFILDLNNDNILDTILLSSSRTDKTSFNNISISLTGFVRKSYSARNNWTVIDKKFLEKNKNIINTDKIFLSRGKLSTDILLFGILDDGGYREDFTIISIKNNNIEMIFDKNDADVDIEIPISLTDLDDDGRNEFIFRNMFELYKKVDSLNADVGVYSPYLVYSIDKDFKLNKVLTKKYNDENYVFAGYNYSEKIKILYPRDKKKKPSIFK